MSCTEMAAQLSERQACLLQLMQHKNTSNANCAPVYVLPWWGSSSFKKYLTSGNAATFLTDLNIDQTWDSSNEKTFFRERRHDDTSTPSTRLTSASSKSPRLYDHQFHGISIYILDPYIYNILI